MPSAQTSFIYNRRPKLIEVKIYFNLLKTQTYFSTGIRVDRQYWNSDTKNIYLATPDFQTTYSKLMSIINDINSIILSLEVDKIQVTPANVSKHIKLVKKRRDYSVGDNFNKFVQEEILNSDLSISTKISHQHTLNLIIDMKASCKFTDIDFQFVQGFDRFLRIRYKNQNTITKHHKNLRKYVNLAGMKRYIRLENIQNFKMFKYPAITGSKEPFTMADLKRMEGMDVSGDDKVILDMFLFGCYTGLRISDILSLQNDHISITKEGNVLTKVMVKLEKQNRKVKLPLYKLFNGSPDMIYYRYKNEGQYLFPKISESKIRLRLKVVLGDESVKFHASRHTFLTIIAWKTGNVFTVMNLGGISSIATAQTYINVASDYVNTVLNNIEW